MRKEPFLHLVGISLVVVLVDAAAEVPHPQADAVPAVAVYNPELDGGASCGEKGILDALKRMPDLAASAISDLSAEFLAKHQVLIVPDVFRLGKGGQGWEESLPKFVNDGGGIFYSFHCPAMRPESVFPEIVEKFQRHFPRKLSAVIPHPITFMMAPFETSYADHRDITPGKAAQVLLKCAKGEPLAVAGSVGKGRVVVSGAVLGFGPASEAEPEGDELRLLRQGILWLAQKDDFPEQEAKRGILRAVVPSSWRQPERLAVAIRAFVPDGMRRGSASAAIELKSPAGKTLGSETVEIDLSQELKTEEPAEGHQAASRAGFVVLESKTDFETRDLPDGDYGLILKMKSFGAEVEESRTIRLRGQAAARDEQRNAEVRERISGMAIKFEFCQGFPIMKDMSTHLPFIKAMRERGFDAYEFMPHGTIWNDDTFKIFEQFLKTAKSESFPVWATLTPYPTHKIITEAPDKGHGYYLKTVERFGELAARYDNFVGYSFDDFNYYMGYFTPALIERMTQAGRAKSDSLLFAPLLYYPGLTEEFFREYGPFIDGVVFHFRAESGPASYIEGYDASSFQDHAECMRTEMRRVRKLAGTEPVICGIYIWYTRGGWGVHYREGAKRFTEGHIRAGKVPGNVFETHTAMDALLKVCVAHEYADALRVYGLGIGHPAYSAMGAMIRNWKERKIPWGFRLKSGK